MAKSSTLPPRLNTVSPISDLTTLEINDSGQSESQLFKMSDFIKTDPSPEKVRAMIIDEIENMREEADDILTITPGVNFSGFKDALVETGDWEIESPPKSFNSLKNPKLKDAQYNEEIQEIRNLFNQALQHLENKIETLDTTQEIWNYFLSWVLDAQYGLFSNATDDLENTLASLGARVKAETSRGHKLFDISAEDVANEVLNIDRLKHYLVKWPSWMLSGARRSKSKHEKAERSDKTSGQEDSYYLSLVEKIETYSEAVKELEEKRNELITAIRGSEKTIGGGIRAKNALAKELGIPTELTLFPETGDAIGKKEFEAGQREDDDRPLQTPDAFRFKSLLSQLDKKSVHGAKMESGVVREILEEINLITGVNAVGESGEVNKHIFKKLLALWGIISSSSRKTQGFKNSGGKTIGKLSRLKEMLEIISAKILDFRNNIASLTDMASENAPENRAAWHADKHANISALIEPTRETLLKHFQGEEINSHDALRAFSNLVKILEHLRRQEEVGVASSPVKAPISTKLARDIDKIIAMGDKDTIKNLGKTSEELSKKWLPSWHPAAQTSTKNLKLSKIMDMVLSPIFNVQNQPEAKAKFQSEPDVFIDELFGKIAEGMKDVEASFALKLKAEKEVASEIETGETTYEPEEKKDPKQAYTQSQDGAIANPDFSMEKLIAMGQETMSQERDEEHSGLEDDDEDDDDGEEYGVDDVPTEGSQYEYYQDAFKKEIEKGISAEDMWRWISSLFLKWTGFQGEIESVSKARNQRQLHIQDEGYKEFMAKQEYAKIAQRHQEEGGLSDADKLRTAAAIELADRQANTMQRHIDIVEKANERRAELERRRIESELEEKNFENYGESIEQIANTIS